MINSDDDNQPDYLDIDSDNDGIYDVIESGNGLLDTNFDGVLDSNDEEFMDSDNNGMNDLSEDIIILDTDDDGIPDYIDLDSDNDGNEDNFNEIDQDNDSISDLNDNCPLIYNPDQLDTDSDKLGDVCDNDDDGDGFEDNQDNCPLIYNPDQADWDNDGIGDICGIIPPLYIEKITFIKKVFPNPINNKLIVSTKGDLEIKDIYFVSIGGKNFKPKSIYRLKEEIEIDVSNIKKGIYLLEIILEKEVNRVKVIIDR